MPTELRDYIVSTAEGNPYYVEEIINKFIDDGVIIPEEGTQGWRLDTNSLDRAHVPLTLTAVLQSRLDGLPSNEKITMQQASIIGRDFWEDPLRLLQGDNPTLDQDLPSLEWCNLIKFQSDSLFRNTRAYSFKHTLMRDVAYETVLKRLRRKYHVQVAQWFIVTAKAIGRLEEFAAVIADHLTRAGDNSGAADWYSMAGARAMSQGALQEARILFDFALQGLPSNDHERRWQVLLKRDELFGILGNLDARKSDDAELLALALKAGNIDWVAEAYQRIGYCAALSGDETSAVEAYESALKAARESDNQRIQASVLPLMAVSLTHLGQIDAAGESAQKGLTIAETLGDDILLARAYLNTSIYYMAVGDLARATKMLIRQVEITQRVGNYLGEAIGLVNLGYNYVVLGQFTLGHAALLRSEKLTNAIGARSYCAYSRLNLGLAHFRLGDCLAAQAAIEKAIASLQEIQDKFGLAAGQVYWGMILEFCSEYLLAQEHFYIAKDLFREMDLLGYAMDAQAGLARCALQEGNLALASQLAQELWKYLSDQGIQAMEFPFRAYLTCAKVFNFEENIELAQVVAAQGYSELMKRADQISDQAWQKSYLDDISEHRELLAFWQELTTNR